MRFRYGILKDGEYPIFDVRYLNGIDYKHRHSIGFTGEYNKFLYIMIYVFRRQIFLDIEWNFGKIDSREAYKRYHMRNKR